MYFFCRRFPTCVFIANKYKWFYNLDYIITLRLTRNAENMLNLESFGHFKSFRGPYLTSRFNVVCPIIILQIGEIKSHNLRLKTIKGSQMFGFGFSIYDIWLIVVH